MPAYNRHNEVPILDTYPDSIEAKYFNVAQTALKRSQDPIRFRIPTLNHLDLLVQEDAWIIVDRVLNDIPIVAWTNFQKDGRNNLHEPIPCEIRLYHFAARMVLNTTLNAMQDILRHILAEQNQAEDGKVVRLGTAIHSPEK